MFLSFKKVLSKKIVFWKQNYVKEKQIGILNYDKNCLLCQIKED